MPLLITHIVSQDFHSNQKPIQWLNLDHYKYYYHPLAELSQRILDSANGLVVFVVNVL